MITAIDTETTLAGNREPIPRLVSVAFANDRGVEILAAHDPRLRSYVIGAYAGHVVAANHPFDAFVLWRALGPEFWPVLRDALAGGRVHDVLTREKYIDIAAGEHRRRGPYNLGAVAVRRAGWRIDKSDPWRRRYGALLGRPISEWPEAALAYAQLDALATWATFVAQEHERARHRLDVFADAPACARAHLALYSMTLRGIDTDPDRVSALDRLVSDRIARLERRLLAAGLARRVHSTARCSPGHRECQCAPKRYRDAVQARIADWCAAQHRSPIRTDPTARNPSGAISVGKKALEHAGIPRGRWGDPARRAGEDPATLYDRAASPPPVGDPPWLAAVIEAHEIECYRELGATRAAWSKNIPVLRAPKIRTRYDELVASGRTSASGFRAVTTEDADADDDDADLADFDCELDPGDEWIGTNTQNFPREGGWRECLIPPPGHVFVMSDFGALELVTFAQVQLDLFGASALASLLQRGLDPHSAFVAEHIAGVPYDQFSKKDPRRQIGKCWNFGKPGAMGEARFIDWSSVTYDVHLSPQQHREIDAKWHRANPHVRMFWDKIKQTMQTSMGPRGPVYTVVQPRTGRIRGGCGFPDAANTHFQGLGADVAKIALWELFCAGLDPASPLFGCYQVMFEHDAYVTVAPPERAAAALAEQERIMIAASAALCPDVPMKVESEIADRFKK